MLTSAFVAAVRRQGSIPASYASTDILAQGDLEVRAVFLPLLEGLRQNYFIRQVTASPDATGRVQLPARAAGAAVRNVQLQLQSQWVPLPQRAMEDADSLTGGIPVAYYLDAGSICLLPSGSSGTLRIRYPARPPAMVLETDTANCGVITAVSAGASTVALTASAYLGVFPIDVVASGPAHQQKVIATAGPMGAVPLTDCLELPVVGDYVCAVETSPFVPLPEELNAALIHRTAGVILRAQGYDDEAGAQLQVAEDAIKRCLPMLTPRNEGNPQRVTGGIRRALNARTGARRIY